MKILKIFTIFLIGIIFFYFSFSFVYLDFNFANWDFEKRLTMIITFCALSLVFAGFTLID